MTISVKSKVMPLKNWLTIILTTGLLVSNSLALDVASASLPAPVIDRKLTIGDRNLRLPSGEWHLVARQEGAVTSQGGITKKATTYQAYAVRLVDGKWRGSLYFRAPISSGGNTGWNVEPCKDDAHVFKDDFNSGFKYPECLLVKKRAGHLSSNSAGVYEQAYQWFVQNKVALPSAVYEVAYYRFASNIYATVIVFLPRSQTAGDEPVIAWAKGLPDRIRRMAEGRDDDATVPELPVKE